VHFFDAGQIQTFGDHLGVPVFTDTSNFVEASALNVRFRGAATWGEVHPGLVSAAFVMVLAIAGLTVWLATRML
jgi:hypothetical protein